MALVDKSKETNIKGDHPEDEVYVNTTAELRAPRATKVKQLCILLKQRFSISLRSPKTILTRLIVAVLFYVLMTVATFFQYYDPSQDEYVNTSYTEYPDPHLVDSVFDVCGYDTQQLIIGSRNSTADRQHVDDIVEILTTTKREYWEPNIITTVMGRDAFQNSLKNAQVNDTLCAGIFIEECGNPSVPWKYTIHVDGAYFSDEQNFYQDMDSWLGSNPYVDSGFLSIQAAIDEAIMQKEKVTKPDIAASDESILDQDFWINNFPYIENDLEDDDDGLFNKIIGLYINISLLFYSISHLTSLVEPKNDNVVRAYTVVGVPMHTYWGHWLLYSLFEATILSLLYLLVISLEKVFLPTSPGYVALYLFLGSFGIVAFNLSVSSYISDTEIAIVPALVFQCVLPAAVYIPVIMFEAPFAIQCILTVIHPVFGIMQGGWLFYLCSYQYSNVGVSLGNLWSSGIGPMYICQALSFLLWSIKATCLRHDDPLAPSLKKFIYRNLCRKINSKKEPQFTDTANMNGQETQKSIEPLPKNAQVAVSIENLVKEFGGTRAVNNLSMKICKNEIFGFLGHNGAGKTTTLNMLTGDFLPTDGLVDYYFNDGTMRIESAGSQMASIQQRIGFCPQYNMLFDELTCKEHLELFAKLKGGFPIKDGKSESEALSEEIDRRIKEIGFASVADGYEKKIKEFSGGMKRKVSIAISLLGDPEVVFLDEPTSGMDPYSRRLVWDMIARMKTGRSIVLTTHHMDEADLLSDRIGIIKKGQLIASGTPLFLKHKFGAGYNLSFTYGGSNMDSEKKQLVYNEILENIKCSQFVVEKEGRHHFKLGFDESKFHQLLNWLSDNECNDISLQMTTLDDVFMKAGAEGFNSNTDGLDSNKDGSTNIDVIHDIAYTDIWKNLFWPISGFKRISLLFRLMLTEEVSWEKSIAMFFSIGYLLAGLFIARFVTFDPDPCDQNVDVYSLDLKPSLLTDSMPNATIFGVQGINPKLRYVSTMPSLEVLLNGNGWAGGLEYDGPERILANNSIVPGISLVQSAISNALLQNKHPNSGILASLNTIPPLDPCGSDDDDSVDVMGIVFPLLVFMSLGSLAYGLLTYMKLEETGRLVTMRITGVSKGDLFLAITLTRLCIFFVPLFLIFLIVALALQNPLVGGGGRWLATILLLLAYAYSIPPLSLLLYPLIPNYKKGRGILQLLWLLIGAGPHIIATLIAPPLVRVSAETSTLIMDILCISPMVSLLRGMEALWSVNSNDWSKVWSWDTRIFYCILMPFAIGTILWIYTFRKYRISLFKKPKPLPDGNFTGDTGDVANGLNKNFLYVRGLSKAFFTETASKFVKCISPLLVCYWTAKCRKKRFCLFPEPKESKALKNVDLAINKGETLVLLGPSGAGKTTAMKIMTLETNADNGTMGIGKYIGDLAQNSGSKEGVFDRLFANGFMGYSPQFDALFENATVEQQLRLYAQLRGMKLQGNKEENPDENERQIIAIMKALGLEQHRKKKSKQLSGGYRRKLSLALSVLSSPKTLILDEISTGIDIEARRHIWQMLNPDDKTNLDIPAIFLSTHDMAEAETLASKVAILLNGEIEAFGSIPELVNKYCNFLFIEIMLLDLTTLEESEKVIKALFPNATILESTRMRMRLQLPILSGSSLAKQLGRTYATMESLKASHPVKYYSVCQMTLEQIFLQLTRKALEQQNVEE